MQKLVSEEYALFYDTPVRQRMYDDGPFKHIQKFNVETLRWESDFDWHWVFKGIDPINAAEGNYSMSDSIQFVPKQQAEAKIKAIKAAAAKGKKVWEEETTAEQAPDKDDDASSRFVMEPDSIRLSQCSLCKHYRGEDDVKKNRTVSTCSAFPKGIPGIILVNNFDHRNSFRLDVRRAEVADNGIRWEPERRGVVHPLDED